MVEALDGADGVAAVELNLSCPNLNRRSELRVARCELEQPETRNPKPETHGLMVAQDPEATGAAIRLACGGTKKPVIAKLSPDVTDLTPIAQAAERAGAAALSLANTFTGMSIDPATRRSRLGRLTGGLSGPAIRPLAVYRVWYTAQIVRLPLIGIGGIVRASDALEFFLAGASAVAIGTANFSNPRAALEVLRGVEGYCRRHRVASVQELRGALRP